MTTNGAILIGGTERQDSAKFHAVEAATGKQLPTAISEAGPGDVDAACALAADAAEGFAALAPEARAKFIEAVADAIEAIGDELIVTAMSETGLPRMRLEGERGRTANQLRMFAREVRQGFWLDATIDQVMPERTPPRADLRRCNVALGPVAVFGASNFPLAFSVAGGDTAAAFAAGCPVVVKGHPAHPGTGELVARAIRSAVTQCGLADGVFSYLPGRENALGEALVSDPRIKAVGFTGSRGGGLALKAIAERRKEPIPVYAEMSSVNPVVLLPHALGDRAEAIGEGFVGSLVLGAGQFCTNPGLVIAVEGEALDRFCNSAAAALGGAAPATMLTPAISEACAQGVSALDANPAVKRLASGKEAGPGQCRGALFSASGAAFLKDDSLGDEIFGASSLVVRCSDRDEMAAVIAALEGQLTITVHLDPQDEAAAAQILPLLRDKAGRVLANGWPTGVEVTHAMVHGGPFPATTDGRTTSVGTLAMMRFLRPVCFQDLPDALLPPVLKSDNPLQIPRRIDGEWTLAG